MPFVRTRLAAVILATTLAAIAPSTARAQPAEPPPAWLARLAAVVPPGVVAGAVLAADPAALTATVAVFPAGADDPGTPGSAFDAGQVAEVRLAREGDTLTPVAATLRPRRPSDQAAGGAPADPFGDLHRTLAAKAAALPDGAVPCELHAWSTDRDPKGLNVRAAPSATARILGTLPPPYVFKAKGDNVPEGGWLTEFHVVGFKAGWFLIEGATPPGKDYEDESVYPRNHPKPYAGRGWVHGSKIGAAFANGGTRPGGLFQAPHVDARWTPGRQGDDGDEIAVGNSPKRVLACSGLWALVESQGGVRGWWRGLCANQVTNCS